ncbi:toll/interleukin-1 receptor domain-containing protein [[Clostridium] innocuum]|uniref:toll/interleukin-1 receptor domain-containing protein n=1 Tax=Clostridium innocuum TaxID=1522 RepID=UPI003A4D9FB6
MIAYTLKELGYPEDPPRKLLPWIHMELRSRNLDKMIAFRHDKTIHLYEVSELQQRYRFEISYGNRSQWIDRCWQLNEFVGTKGIVKLFVSNTPYHLRAYIYFDHDGDREDIIEFCKRHEIDVAYDKGSEESLEDMRNRMWNEIAFCADMDQQIFETLFVSSFLYPGISELHEKGYPWKTESKRKKVFISYARKDKEIVDDMIDKLQTSGIRIFMDRRSIDHGDHISESILSGLSECELAIFFLSHAFRNSMMGKQELRAIWTNVISRRKAWMIIRLDDVDPEDIFYSLSDYKYFDAQTEAFDDFIKAVHKKLKEC